MISKVRCAEMDNMDGMDLDHMIEYILSDNPWMEGCLVPDEDNFDLECGALLPGLFSDDTNPGSTSM